MVFNCANTRTQKLSLSLDCHCFPLLKRLIKTFGVCCCGLQLSPAFLGVPGDTDQERMAAFFRFQALQEWRLSHRGK